MVEPTMFAIGFACGVLAAVIALVLLLGTLKGSGESKHSRDRRHIIGYQPQNSRGSHANYMPPPKKP